MEKHFFSFTGLLLLHIFRCVCDLGKISSVTKSFWKCWVQFSWIVWKCWVQFSQCTKEVFLPTQVPTEQTSGTNGQHQTSLFFLHTDAQKVFQSFWKHKFECNSEVFSLTICVCLTHKLPFHSKLFCRLRKASYQAVPDKVLHVQKQPVAVHDCKIWPQYNHPPSLRMDRQKEEKASRSVQ